MTARLRVNLAALVANYRTLAQYAAPAETGAVVKANGYGSGAEQVAEALLTVGCRHLFVARADEGRALRRRFSEPCIYVFEGALPSTLATLLQYRLEPVLNSPDQLRLWRSQAQGPLTLHVDTGMNRLGFPPTVTAGDFPNQEIGLILSHLACADEPDHPLNSTQRQRASQLRQSFPGARISIGNSAGILNGPDFHGDLVRPGIGLYGVNPRRGGGNPMQPALSLEARIVQLRTLRQGETLGYGASWRAPGTRQIGTLGIGYADGLPLALSNRGQVYAAGRMCPLIGRISMDLANFDNTDAQLAAGDWVEVFGHNLSVERVAETADTITYNLLTGITERVTRVYEAAIAPKPAAL